MKFEWDEKKERKNIIKHNIDFHRARTVFNDVKAVYLFDEAHSQDEERFNVIGRDNILSELTVCHCYRGENEEIIRIISARKATKEEVNIYMKGGV